jgi:hypothetical protein
MNSKRPKSRDPARVAPVLIPPAGPRGRAGRELPLVRWTAMAFVVGIVLALVLLVWGLATGRVRVVEWQ